MSYYIRILGTQDPDIHLDDISEELDAEALSAQFGVPKNEKPEKWTAFELKNEKGKLLATVERNPVGTEGIGREELDEFKQSILEFQPASAAKWLNDFFDKVKVIYAMELMPIGMEAENYHIITTTQGVIWELVNGILQADEEGFTNEEGYHILWQFPDDADGEWNCAVLNEKGEWENFNMDLADEKQREEFKAGKVPAAAKKLK
jgi:hypothetical protein